MSLKNQLIDLGFESSHLDSLVDEAASRLASNTNNDGMKSQLDFLVITCCWSEDEILDALGGQKDSDLSSDQQKAQNEAAIVIVSDTDAQYLSMYECADGDYALVVPEYLINWQASYKDHASALGELKSLAECVKLWVELSDVPFREDPEDDLVLDVDWHIFEKGKPRLDIWHWFESTYNCSVAEDLMHIPINAVVEPFIEFLKRTEREAK